MMRKAIRQWGLLFAVFLLSLWIRKALLPIQGIDYLDYISPWYDIIAKQGWQAFRHGFSNYNMPYLYLLLFASHLPFLKIINIKLISIFFDVVLSIGVCALIQHRYPHGEMPVIATRVILLLPTVFINSALWAQCDSIFTAFLVWGLVGFLKGRQGWACFCFGLAFAFKLQAIFLFPLLLVLWLMGKLSLRSLCLIPVIFFVVLLPALIVGASLHDLLSIYLVQTQYQNDLSMNAPSFFALLPAVTVGLAQWRSMGVLLAMSVTLLFTHLVTTGKRPVDAGMLIKLALIFSLVVPFFLPGMHERYFYVADVLSVVYAFYFPRYFYVPIVVQLCSLESYLPFLLGKDIIPLSVLAFLLLGVTTLTIWDYSQTYILPVTRRVRS